VKWRGTGGLYDCRAVDAGRHVTRYGVRLGGWLAFVGAVAAAGYAQRFSNVKQPKDPLYHWSTFTGEIVFFAIAGFVVWLLVLGLDPREALGLRRPTSWRSALARMLVAAVVMVVVAAIVGRYLNPGKEQGIVEKHWEPAHAAAYVANFFVFTFVGPVVEELTFRGIGFRLLARVGRPLAVVLIGVLFGVWHGLVEALPLLVAFGWLLAWIRERTHSLYPCVALHAFFNGIQLILSVAVH
jgi:CAAX protease family protein